MNQINEIAQPLYESGDLLGYSVSDDEGKILHNESFFSDEFAWLATKPFADVLHKMERANRVVNRLTVELDDVALIYRKLDEGHTLFILRLACELDEAANILP